MNPEERQSCLFDDIIRDYEAHYDDPLSQQYRNRFLYDPLFEGVRLDGARALEAMCGSGQTTGYLLSKGARVTGLDISRKAIDRFRERWPTCQAVCASCLESRLPADAFDCVVIIGGLHHAQPHVQESVDEVCRLLKPGGVFCFGEPHAGSLPDLFRKGWYRFDHHFTSDEQAVDLTRLRTANADRFEFIRETYVGGVAYLFVLNSLMFRIPLRSKSVYAPLLFRLERLFGPVQGKRLSCFSLSQWRKK